MNEIGEALVPHRDRTAPPSHTGATGSGTGRLMAAAWRGLTLLCVGYAALYFLCEL